MGGLRSGSGDEGKDDDQTLRSRFLNPEHLGGVFGRAALVFTLLTVVSMVTLAITLLSAADEPFVDQPRLEEPILGYVWLLSFTGAVLSAAGYAVWSFWRQRKLRAQLPTDSESGVFERAIRTLQVITADSDDLDEYEKRVQKTVFAVVVTVLFGQMPARIWLHALQSL